MRPKRRAIAVSALKGGVGKTTTAINLAAAAARRGRRVLLVDLDPQGSVAACLGLPGRKGLGDWLLGEEGFERVARRRGLPAPRGGAEAGVRRRYPPATGGSSATTSPS